MLLSPALGSVHMKVAKFGLVMTLCLLPLLFIARYLFVLHSPRVWTRAMPYDEEKFMERDGRHLRFGLNANGCGRIHLNPSPYEDPEKPHKLRPGAVLLTANRSIPVRLGVENDALVAYPGGIEGWFFRPVTAMVMPAANCDVLPISPSVNFILPEGAKSPLPLQAGQELWIELRVPPSGPPMPLQLALKQDGVWTPLVSQ
jgi:hypothetical protein